MKTHTESLPSSDSSPERSQIALLERKTQSKKDSREQKLDSATERVAHELDKEEAQLEKILLTEGLEVSSEDLKELYQAIPELFTESNPQLSKYLQDLSPELNKVLSRLNSLNEKGAKQEALDVLTIFLEKQQQSIEKIKNPEIREQISILIGATLDIAKLEEELSSQAKLELISAGTDLIPVIGSMKMMGETVLGKTATGKKLEGKARLLHGAEAVAFLALDAIAIAGLFTTAGAGTVAAEGAKGARVLGTAGKGLKIGKTITRFAAFTRKTTELTKVSKTIYRLGKMAKKYPRIIGAVARLAKSRKLLKQKNFSQFVASVKNPDRAKNQ